MNNKGIAKHVKFPDENFYISFIFLKTDGFFVSSQVHTYSSVT